MSQGSSKVFTFLSPALLQEAVSKGRITIPEAEALKKADITRYYNRKLQRHLRYGQWTEFFYVYHNAEEFSHGVDAASHVMAAHAYEMAYSNSSKAFSTLEKIRDSPGYSVSLHLLEAYQALKRQNLAPLSCNWSTVVNICSVLALGIPAEMTKYEKMMKAGRFQWHYDIAPWKYSKSVADVRDDFIYRQRRGE